MTEDGSPIEIDDPDALLFGAVPVPKMFVPRPGPSNIRSAALVYALPDNRKEEISRLDFVEEKIWCALFVSLKEEAEKQGVVEQKPKAKSGGVVKAKDIISAAAKRDHCIRALEAGVPFDDVFC